MKFVRRIALGISLSLLLHALVLRCWARLWRPHLVALLLHPSRDVRARCATHCARDLVVRLDMA